MSDILQRPRVLDLLRQGRALIQADKTGDEVDALLLQLEEEIPEHVAVARKIVEACDQADN